MHHVTSSPRATLAATEFFIIDLMWFPWLAVPLPCQLCLYHSCSRPRGLTGREPSPRLLSPTMLQQNLSLSFTHHQGLSPPPPASAFCSCEQARPLDKRVVKRSKYWRWLSTTIKLHQPPPFLPCQSSRRSSGSMCVLYVCFGRRRCGGGGVDIWWCGRQSQYSSASAPPLPVEAFEMS